MTATRKGTFPQHGGLFFGFVAFLAAEKLSSTATKLRAKSPS